MTSAELHERRRDPLYVQTMRRPSIVTRGAWVYSDIEEFSPEARALRVSEMRLGGWTEAGEPFTRHRPDHA